jgi:carbamate kinase
MPYLKQKDRTSLDKLQRRVETPGDVAYVVTRDALDLLPEKFRFADLAKEMGRMYRKIRADDKDEEVGAILCAMMEYYRRLVAKYEDKAIKRNGDMPGYARRRR